MGTGCRKQEILMEPMATMKTWELTNWWPASRRMSNPGYLLKSIQKELLLKATTKSLTKKPISISILQKNSPGRLRGCLKPSSVLSLILGNYADVYVVIALLVLNAVLGYFQEQKASKAVDALKKQLQINARVLRDGTWHFMPSREPVPGDIGPDTCWRLRPGRY